LYEENGEAKDLWSSNIDDHIKYHDWNTIDWWEVKKSVFNLQKRIYKAVKAGKVKRAKRLMYLLQCSTGGIALAVRNVTIDDTVKTPENKVNLINEVVNTISTEWKTYKALPAKRLMIPKSDGNMRAMAIPAIRDRVMQAAIKLVLEPYYEAKFESCNYGFRPAMGVRDAVEDVINQLLRKQKWILSAGIKEFFDYIDHKYLLQQIDRRWRKIVRRWLKAGYMYDKRIRQTKMGTQGSISPLLLNIALDKMETDLIEHLGDGNKIGTAFRPKVIRYADDFVIIHEDKEVIEESRRFMEGWLSIRGLSLSEEKTKIVHSTEGFDFLGHHFRHYKNRIKGTYKLQLLNGTKAEQNRANASHVFRAEPMKEKLISHWKEISEIIGQMKSVTPDTLIRRLQPIITEWANMYRSVHASEAFSKLDHFLWKRLYQWANRRHPKKGKKWVANKYFGEVGGRKWTFMDMKTGRYLRTYSLHKVKTGSYVKVGYDRSYYDGDGAYWTERLSKGYGDITPSKANMFRKQEGICPHCNYRLTNDDLLEGHHKIYKGGEGKSSILMHHYCYDELHRESLK
jgi:RNA-directed DNA polymerase